MCIVSQMPTKFTQCLLLVQVMALQQGQFHLVSNMKREKLRTDAVLLFLGFPETRGALKAMNTAQLRQLAAYYQPGPANELKAAVLKRLGVLFGMPL